MPPLGICWFRFPAACSHLATIRVRKIIDKIRQKMNKTKIMPFVWIFFSIVVCNLLKIFLEIKIENDLSICKLMIFKVRRMLIMPWTYFNVFFNLPGHIKLFYLPNQIYYPVGVVPELVRMNCWINFQL